MSVLVVGSTGLDNVETPSGKIANALGGSAFYAATASSFFASTSLLGIVGDDFPRKHIDFLRKRKIDLSGLEVVRGGKTFRWSGKYHQDLNTRDTLDLQLNTFLQFAPRLNDGARKKKLLFLANIDPELHLQVLSQISRPQFVLADTMDHWIKTKSKALSSLLRKIDAFVLNDSEARLLTGEDNLIRAAKAVRKMGPKIVLIKKGEHGALLFQGDEIFSAPAFPLPEVVDPTGAGDTFAGAFIGFLAGKKISASDLRKAVLYGTVVASFTCEAFSVEKLKRIGSKHIADRAKQLMRMARV